MPEKKTIMLTLTEHCNLNCRYCYEKNKSLRSMSLETAQNIVKQELTKEDGFEVCEVQFFGGEPFLEFQLIREICDYIWTRKWPKEVLCFATTNGTLVHGEIKQWLYENRTRFTCSLSLDGNKAAHDINRCNSFDLIDLEFFQNTWPLQTAKMTISPESLPYLADSVIFLHEAGIPFSNNLAYGVDWGNKKLLTIMSEQLNRLAWYYIEHPQIELCRMLDLHIENVNYKHKVNRWCGAGVSLSAYDVDGKCYPCHLFQPLSSKNKDPIDKVITAFTEFDTIDPRCSDCPIYNVCPTCYGHNYAATGNIAERDEDLCKFTKLSTLVSSFIWLKKMERYTQEELGLSDELYRMIFDGAKLIQECLPSQMA